MAFANPAALWLLFLALLLLLARRRRPRRRMAVAALHLWDAPAAQSASPLARRLRRHWLLLLQAAIVAAIVIAIARPMWASRDAYAAIVIDTSLSMSARTNGASRLDAARQRALTWAQSLPRGTHVRLITASAAPAVVGEFMASDEALAGAVHTLATTDGAANLDAAVDFASAADRRPSRVLVVTDATRPAASDDRRIEWSLVGSPAVNLAATTLSAKRRVAASGEVELLAEVSNYGDAPATTTLTLTRAGAVLLSRSLTLAPHGTARVVEPLRTTGVIEARIDASDAITADNVRQVVIPLPEATRVAISGSSYFVERALRSRAGVTLVVSGAEPADVLVCASCAAVPAGAGPGVLLIPPRASDPLPAAVLAQSAERHPVSSGLDLGGVDAVPVQGRALDPASVVLASAGGRPAILAYELEGRRVVELRLDLDRSSLPLTPSFPVLMANALDWLAGRDQQPVAYTAGDPIVRPVPPGAQGVTVAGPRSENVAAVVNGARLVVATSSEAGVYTVHAGAISDTFVVNPATAGESDVSTAAAQTPVPVTAGAPSQAVEGRVEWGVVFLLAALGLLAAEWWLRSSRTDPRAANAGGSA